MPRKTKATAAKPKLRRRVTFCLVPSKIELVPMRTRYMPNRIKYVAQAHITVCMHRNIAPAMILKIPVPIEALAILVTEMNLTLNKTIRQSKKNAVGHAPKSNRTSRLCLECRKMIDRGLG